MWVTKKISHRDKVIKNVYIFRLLIIKDSAVSYSKGYMILLGSALQKDEDIVSDFKPLYLRRGVIRAVKN